MNYNKNPPSNVGKDNNNKSENLPQEREIKNDTFCRNNKIRFCVNTLIPIKCDYVGNIPHEYDIAIELAAEKEINHILAEFEEIVQQKEEGEKIPILETTTIKKGMVKQVERIQIPRALELESLLRTNAKLWNMANWLVRGLYFSRLKPNRLDINAQRERLREKFLEKAKKQFNAQSSHPPSYFFSSYATIEIKVQEILEKKIKHYNKSMGREGYGNDAKLMSYNEIWNLLKFTRFYQLMPSQTAQQTLKTLISNWRGYFRAKQVWRESPSKFIGERMPYPPGYQLKKVGLYTVTFTNQQCKLEKGFLYFPTIREKKPILKTLEEKRVWNKIQAQGFDSLEDDERYVYELITYEERGKIIKDNNKETIRYFPPLKVSPRMAKIGAFKAVRVVPRGMRFICEIVYEEPIKFDPNLRIIKILGIDIGQKNLLSTINNIGLHPLLIRGDPVVSVNKYFKKQISELRLEMNIATDNVAKAHYRERIQKISLRRYNKIYDYFHKATKYIIDCCRVNSIGKIIIGYNKQWKIGRKVSKRFRKNFYPIPFDRLLKLLRYKAELVGIVFVEIEESYTSQTCAFCGKIDKTSRVKRGLYVCKHCKDPKAINADVNGAVSIVKKAEPQAFDNVPQSWLLLAPKTTYLRSWSKKCIAAL